MFSDVSGYTAMSERLDPEDVREIVDQVCGVASEIIESYGGRIDKVLGDAVMAIFGDPIAHEDDAERAVRSALELHDAVDRLSPAIERRTGFAVKLHTGINTGVVVTGVRDSEHPSAGPLGDTVNLASRLEGLASPGDILLGPATSRLVGGVFDLEDLGDHAVKGKAGHIAVSRVVGVAADRRPPSRRHGEFVGRQEELGVLLSAVERLRDGAGGVITVVGEAGAGKTRILSEVRDRIGEDVRWLEGRAYAFGERTPYAPVIDLISRVVGIAEGDAPEKVRRRLEETVSGILGGDPTNIVGPLLRLYAVETAEESAIDREAFQGRLFHSTSRLIEGLASGRPTVVCLQDLHWADPPTVSLVQELVELLRSKVLFVFNTRPGFQLAAGERTIHLSELSPRQTRQLVASLLGTPDPPSELVAFVESRTDGNPFFTEEVVNSLIEAGLLAISGCGWSVQGRIDEATVPATIQGVIAARIDRLDQTRRRVLQEASVVGREFLYRIVNEVSGSGPELAPSLSVLERADLIRERTSDPDLEYLQARPDPRGGVRQSGKGRAA
jgi:class 3 adenylate cyclase